MGKSTDKQKFAHEKVRQPLEPLTDNQDRYFDAIDEPVDDDNGSGAFVFGIGYAGTGKTYCAVVKLADKYLEGIYRKIIIVKPTVGPDEMGFLPGTLEEKIDPWTATVTEPLKERLGKTKFECDYGKRILAEPLEFIRGKTFDDSAIIVDEAQNLTIGQIKAIITRIGLGSKMIFCGDTRQCDLPKGTPSGLMWFINEVKRQQREGIEIIDFARSDCVRSGGCKLALDIIEAAPQ